MSVDELPELPERGCYQEGRDKRMRPEELEPGDECLLRLRNRETEDVFEMAATVREPVDRRESDCDRLYVDVHCNKTFDREVEFKFDKETGCLIQFCGGGQQEIGYVVRTIKDPEEALAMFAAEGGPSGDGDSDSDPETPDAPVAKSWSPEVALQRAQAERPASIFLGPLPPRIR